MHRFSALACACTLSGCAALPSLPNNYDFPIDEILRFTTCQLRDGYRELARYRHHPKYDATNYTAAISIQPKVDAEITAKAGLTGKSATAGNFIRSWALGAATGGGAPGAGGDWRTHQDGKVSYNVLSADLIDRRKTNALDCDQWSAAAHTLIRNLQVRKWLVDSTEAALTRGNSLAIVDNQSFQTEVYIKFGAGGAFTYAFPFGTDFASLSGQYWTDQFLSVTITHNTPKAKVIFTNTLPSDEGTGKSLWKRTKSALVTVSPGTISQDTKIRLDLLQLQQSIQNVPR